MFQFMAYSISKQTQLSCVKALELSRLMRHRGPDWSGIYASDKAILAHERLSIVDVNAGQTSTTKQNPRTGGKR